MKITSLKKSIVRIAENITQKSKGETSEQETPSNQNTHERRLSQLKKDPHKRVDSDDMTEAQKMDSGFNGSTYTINGIEGDF